MTTGFNLALGRSLRSGCISFATWNARTLVENTGGSVELDLILKSAIYHLMGPIMLIENWTYWLIS